MLRQSDRPGLCLLQGSVTLQTSFTSLMVSCGSQAMRWVPPCARLGTLWVLPPDVGWAHWTQLTPQPCGPAPRAWGIWAGTGGVHTRPSPRTGSVRALVWGEEVIDYPPGWASDAAWQGKAQSTRHMGQTGLNGVFIGVSWDEGWSGMGFPGTGIVCGDIWGPWGPLHHLLVLGEAVVCVQPWHWALTSPQPLSTSHSLPETKP